MDVKDYNITKEKSATSINKQTVNCNTATLKAMESSTIIEEDLKCLNKASITSGYSSRIEINNL